MTLTLNNRISIHPDLPEIEITDEFIDSLALRLIGICGSPEAALALLDSRS